MLTRRSPSSTSVIASRSANSAAATPSAIAPAAFSIGLEFTSRRFGKSSSHCCTFFDALASRRRGPMIGSVPSWSTVFGIVLVEVADLVDRRHGDEHDRRDRDHAGR